VKVWVVMYDAYGDFWVDAAYDNEEAAMKHKESGRGLFMSSTYNVEELEVQSSFQDRREMMKMIKLTLGDTVSLQHAGGDILIDWMLDCEAVIHIDVKQPDEAVLTVESPEVANLNPAPQE
jgi:hypothetical protein